MISDTGEQEGAIYRLSHELAAELAISALLLTPSLAMPLAAHFSAPGRPAFLTVMRPRR